jgi:hypothetical protein
MIISLIITWVFWIIIDIINTIFHPYQWYLFLIPPAVLTVGIVLIAQLSSTLCIALTIGLHICIVIMAILNHFEV